jgi:PAS domain S-box-containing protein
MMDYDKMSKEEIIGEFCELNKAYEALKEYYERDIILLNDAEKQIVKSEEKFRKAFLTSPDSVNINRLSDGLYVSINEGFTKILGYTEEEIIGKSSLEMNIWADPEERKEMVTGLKEKGRIENFEAAFRHKNGSVVYGLMSASLMEIEGIPHILNVTKDISERRRIQESLAREQFLVSAIMDNVSDHIYFKDMDSRFIRVNKAQARRFGLNDPTEIIGKTDFDYFSIEHAQQAFNDEQEIIRTGNPLNIEEKETNPNAPDTWVSTVKMPLRDVNNKIVGTFGISRDISKRKKAEYDLEAERNLLRALIDNMPDRIYAKDTDSRFIICNNALVKRMGKSSQEEIIGKSDLELLPADLAKGYYENEQEIMRTGKPHIDHEESMGTVSGMIRWNLTTKVPFSDTNGKILGIVGIGKDITDRKRKETEVQVLSEITQGIVSTSNLDELLTLIHNSLGKVVYAENFFIALYDTKTELFSFPYFIDKFDQTPAPVSMKKSCSAYVYRSAKPFLYSEQEFEKLRKENEVEQVGSPSPSWIGVPLQTSKSIIGVMVLQHYEKENVYSENDVRFLTSIGNQIAIAIERKIAEEEIRLKNELLIVINAEKDKFFSIIAHDLRGPLSAFVSATQILTEDIQSMTLEEVKDIILSMKVDASNVYTLLENLLEWSRLQRGVMEFKPEKHNLKNTLINAIDTAAASARKKNVRINLDLDDDIEVRADSHMIETIVRNLVSNAVKFTHSGGEVSVSALKGKDGTVLLRVSDTGIGMPGEILNKLFKLTEKTNRPGTEGEPSSGLGLLLVKEFIEKNNGKIFVESEPGKGSVFTCSFPAI